MRRLGSPLVLAALGVAAPSAALADPPPVSASPGPAAAPVPPATPVTAPGGDALPPQDPPYNPAKHGGLSYGTWLRATRGTGRRSTGMMITGLSFLGLGVTLAAAGTGVVLAGDSCKLDVTENGVNMTQFCGPKTAQLTGMAVLVAGVSAMGIGIPLTVLGASDVPRAEASGMGASTPRPYLALDLGLRRAGFALHF